MEQLVLCCALLPQTDDNRVFSRLQQRCRITQLLQRCRKQTRKQYTFLVVSCCDVKNKLQSPVGQLKTQRGNLLIPNLAKDAKKNVTKDAKKDSKDEGDSTKEHDEPRDSSTPPGGRRRQ